MKKILLLLLVIIVLSCAAFVFLSGDNGATILADTATVRLYRIDGAFTDHAFAEVSFRKNVSGERYVNIVADLDGDGSSAENEWIVRNEKALIAKDYANRFSFVRPEGMEEGTVTLLAVLSEEKISDVNDLPEKNRKVFDASTETTDIVEQFGLNVPGASEDLKRGIGLIPKAYANDFDASISGNVPDLTGGPMDCFAIATANNLIKMTEENGRRNDLPEDPANIIADLKQDMQYNNGIINANFLTGKQAYVSRHNLPITTREIRRPTKEDIEEAFTTGDAVEVSTTMLRSRSGKPNTGHVLTGVGAAQDGDELGIAVHDPATPPGADMFLVGQTGGANPYLMINYPLWDGIVIIDAIYIQTWHKTTDGASSTGVAPESESSEAVLEETQKGTDLGVFNDGEAMEVIIHQDTYIPVSQLRVGPAHPPHATGPGCPADHWHADYPPTALDGRTYPDPLPGGCGFGTLEERPVMNYFPHDQYAE